MYSLNVYWRGKRGSGGGRKENHIRVNILSRVDSWKGSLMNCKAALVVTISQVPEDHLIMNFYQLRDQGGLYTLHALPGMPLVHTLSLALPQPLQYQPPVPLLRCPTSRSAPSCSHATSLDTWRNVLWVSHMQTYKCARIGISWGNLTTEGWELVRKHFSLLAVGQMTLIGWPTCLAFPGLS